MPSGGFPHGFRPPKIPMRDLVKFKKSKKGGLDKGPIERSLCWNLIRISKSILVFLL